jgi:superfamily II DNA or RNA helicase
METYLYQLHSIGFKQLNTFQQDIVRESISKKSGALSLPLGSGKSIIALVLSFYFTQNNELPILVVCSKSLITNWIEQIEKFYGKQLKYKIIHPSMSDVTQLKIKKKYHIYIITTDVLAKAYKNHFITNSFIKQVYVNRGIFMNTYNVPYKPYLNHTIADGLLYSIQWGCLVVDEAQLYTNINTHKCQA